MDWESNEKSLLFQFFLIKIVPLPTLDLLRDLRVRTVEGGRQLTPSFGTTVRSASKASLQTHSKMAPLCFGFASLVMSCKVRLCCSPWGNVWCYIRRGCLQDYSSPVAKHCVDSKKPFRMVLQWSFVSRHRTSPGKLPPNSLFLIILLEIRHIRNTGFHPTLLGTNIAFSKLCAIY